MPKTKLELEDPIRIQGSNGELEVTVLEFVPLRAGHIADLPADGSLTLGHTLDIAANLTGQPRRVINELTPRDLKRVTGVIEGFLSDFQPTGGG